MITDLAGGPHETLPRCRIRQGGCGWLSHNRPRLALTIGGNCTRAGQRRRGDEDDAGWALKMCAAEERRCAAPCELDLTALAGHLQRSGLRDGLDEAIRSRPSISFLNASDSR